MKLMWGCVCCALSRTPTRIEFWVRLPGSAFKEGNYILPYSEKWVHSHWLSKHIDVCGLLFLNVLMSLTGNLHVGRWGTQLSRGGTWSGTLCRSCLSSSAAYACWAADPPPSSSSTPSLRNMGRIFSSQPPWGVRDFLPLNSSQSQ